MTAIDQIRTVDKTRIIRIFESLTKSDIEKCQEVIKELCGLKTDNCLLRRLLLEKVIELNEF